MKFLATKNKIEIVEIFICNFKYTVQSTSDPNGTWIININFNGLYKDMTQAR